MSRTTLDTTLSSHLSYTGLSPSMVCFSKTILLDLMNQLCSPNPRCITTSGLGFFYFARHYFRNRFFFLFLWVLRCFSSPRSLLIYYFTHIWISGLFFPDEFPHSDISGSLDMCSSPKLFAAYHVLLRLLVPRHSPYALSSLTYFFYFKNSKTLWFYILALLLYSVEYSSLPFYLEYLLYSCYIFFNVLQVNKDFHLFHSY